MNVKKDCIFALEKKHAINFKMFNGYFYLQIRGSKFVSASVKLLLNDRLFCLWNLRSSHE